jgi:two-component system cell cycle sensor histidine kinase/response regulator CckA
VATVLVVDDQAASREIACSTLERDGYQVIEASEGHQALTLAKNSHPDVVVTDVLMPGMDGYELVRALRADPDTAGIPVLFFSANYRQDEAQPLAMAFGVGQVLAKDALPEELLDAVAAAVHDQPAPVILAEPGFGAQHVDLVNAKLLENIRALEESEARFAAMAQASPVGIVIADSRGQASYVNPRLTEITQAPAAELLGQGWLSCLGHDQREALRAGPGVLPASLDGERQHEHLTLRSGQQRSLTVLIRPVRDSEQAVAGFVAMIDDVTAMAEADERRRAEERDRESEARRRVTDRFESMARLAGGVAHEFNNLLNVIMSFNQFVEEEITDASGTVLTDAQAQAILGDIDQISRAGQRASHLSRQLLIFGGRRAVQPAVVDINVLIGEVRDTLAASVGDHVTITSQLDPDLCHVRVNASQLSQALLNLAANATDAMPDGGSLHFETAVTATEGASGQAAGLPVGEYVHVAVTDTGHGMTAAIAAKAMEPFFTTKSQGQGTGLGLATAYGVVKQASGEMIIDSAPGRGTTIHLYLPVIDGPVDLPGQIAAASASAGQTVLVVDDEGGLLQSVTRILTGAGYHVLAAPGGKEALAIAEGHEGAIHALLTDIAMPAMNGRELALALQRARPATAVLYMSGYAAAIMNAQGMLDPNASVVSKPFTKDELLSAVNAVLSKGAARPGSVV